MRDEDKREDMRAIIVDYRLSAPPRKVWRALTEPQLLATWLMPNDIKPEVGHRFTFRTTPAPGFNGIVQCEVLKVEPNSRFVYSWRGGPLDTTVTWTLQPSSTGGADLRLEHAGFGPEHGTTYDMLSDGWRKKAAEALERISSSLRVD
ncbi:SRPBCC domain-containing protein [Bradyrhizobium xenonodulans]|uniref:SRPBCC domain-containing protein n=1 Tax=Bradyrhizobium xenonodulans TaxID=2736875 RepID=A0ABY7MRR0_9BRAD|nr:SRPBCC domain-containing protein [Bradyrhizobium xenonodulans]WBL80626.1 SRPBCC domain-containing protein [Bradyrhizobium xenonodulans]